MTDSKAILAEGGFESVLAAYAAGNLPCALHALVGAHLELSPKNRAFVASLEESLGSNVSRQECCAPVRNRAARLDAIFCCDKEMEKSRPPGCEDPRALTRYCGGPIDTLPFRNVIPGVREYVVEKRGGLEAKLFRIAPGKRIPQHTHEGMELTLVIRGSFSDATGCFARGDVAFADEELDHVPVADEGAECVCFTVLDAPLKLTGPIGRFFNRFLRS